LGRVGAPGMFLGDLRGFNWGFREIFWGFSEFIDNQRDLVIRESPYILKKGMRGTIKSFHKRFLHNQK
jgi:hypothetical protein